MLGGVLAITHLPVAQYPTVAPPSIAINATYAGASAETVQDTVTSVIEQQMNGIDNLLYMSSSSSASGQSTVTLYFQSGTDPDIAQVQVQNKLQLAIPNLPQTVQQAGHHGRQIHPQLPDVFRPVVHQPGRERHRAGQFYFVERARPHPPRHRRGRSGPVRHRIRHAHLAEPRPARKLQSRCQRRHQRDSGAKHAGPGGTTRGAPGGEGTGNQHHPARPKHVDHGQTI